MAKKKQLTVHDYTCSDDLQIPADLGVGVEWVSDDGVKYRSIKSWEGKRKAYLYITTYGPMSGGMHSYARIRSSGPSCVRVKTGEVFSMAGYGKNRPDDMLATISVEATRTLTKVERDLDGELVGPVGGTTCRFNSESEARQAAIALFKKKFGPGWQLIDDEDSVVIAET